MESAYAFRRAITIAKRYTMRAPWRWPKSLRRTVSAGCTWSIWMVLLPHHVVNYRVLEQIAVRTSLVIDFGGGVKSDEDLIIAFENGAQMVTGGSIAVKNPELFARLDSSLW